MPSGKLTAQQERMQRLLAKRKDDDKLLDEVSGRLSALSVENQWYAAQAAAYVSRLSPADLKMSLRVDCDKLWNRVLHAHSRLQEEEEEGIGYVHHIVAHTLNHPEARWLGRCVYLCLYACVLCFHVGIGAPHCSQNLTSLLMWLCGQMVFG
jgi:hypothetical protein